MNKTSAITLSAPEIFVDFDAYGVGIEAEETCPAGSAEHIEKEETTWRHAIGARKQSRQTSAVLR